jgi:hypothetical protein
VRRTGEGGLDRTRIDRHGAVVPVLGEDATRVGSRSLANQLDLDRAPDHAGTSPEAG